VINIAVVWGLSREKSAVVCCNPASGLTDASQPAGQQDEDHQPSTTTAAAATSAVVAADGRLVQNGRGDGVAMATTGARQRSVDSPSD